MTDQERIEALEAKLAAVWDVVRLMDERHKLSQKAIDLLWQRLDNHARMFGIIPKPEEVPA